MRSDPFRIFFDRSFDDAFALAADIADGDEGQAAQLCATAYGRAYARWSILGRTGDAQRFIQRRIRRGMKRRKVAAPTLEAGIGYKPWVYVSATESGTTRKRTFWMAGSAAATVGLTFGAIGLTNNLTANPAENRVITQGEPSVFATSTSSPPLVTTTSSPPPSSTSEEDDTWKGFTLDLEDLPTSPAEVEGFANQPAGTGWDPTAETVPPTRPVTPASTEAPKTTVSPITTTPATTVAPATTPPERATTTTAAPTTTTTVTLAPTSTTPASTTTTTTTPTTTTTVAPSTTTTVAPTTTVNPKDSAKNEREQAREDRKREREDRREN